MKRIHTEANKSNIKHRGNLKRHWSFDNYKKSKGKQLGPVPVIKPFFTRLGLSILGLIKSTRGFSRARNH